MVTIEDVMKKKNFGFSDPDKLDKDFIDDLKDFVNFLENNPHFIPRYRGISLNYFAENLSDMFALAKGENWETYESGNSQSLVKNFGKHSFSIVLFKKKD